MNYAVVNVSDIAHGHIMQSINNERIDNDNFSVTIHNDTTAYHW